ncbi:UFC1 enzyme, partial [Acromyrmex heyeri]
MVDESTKKTLSNIPLLQTKAGPRDKDLWVQRLKEEYQALIKVRELTRLFFTCKLGPWLAVEIPELIEKGIVVHKDEEKKS